jgi:hypothetical protein
MSDNRKLLDLVNASSRPAGITMGSVRWTDPGPYRKPQSIRKEGHVRLAEPPVINTGHDPTIVAHAGRYADGRVKQMPGLPAYNRVKIIPIDGEE